MPPLSGDSSIWKRMTPSVDSLIESIEKLSSQIEDLTTQVNDLSSDSRDLSKIVQLGKEYNEELNNLTNLSRTQPRKYLIAALQDEVKVVHQLENENCELKTAIKNHREVLDLILNKFRAQNNEIQRLNRLESKNKINTDDLVLHRYKYFEQNLNKMVHKMNEAFLCDEAKILQQERLVEVLRKENDKIKRFLQPNRQT